MALYERTERPFFSKRIASACIYPQDATVYSKGPHSLGEEVECTTKKMTYASVYAIFQSVYRVRLTAIVCFSGHFVAILQLFCNHSRSHLVRIVNVTIGY